MRRLLPLLPLLFAASLSASTITAIHPSRGFYYGGELVGIEGDDLVGGGCEYNCTGVSVFFGDAAAEVLSANNWGIVVRTPPHRVGSADITIRGPHGSGSGERDVFTYMPSYRFLLFPAVYDRVLGAAGTEWRTDLRLVNRSIDWVWMSPLDLRPLTAHVNPQREFGFASAPGGGLILLGTLDGPISMTSRLQETSRGDDAFDVELPIVDAKGLFVDQIWLREVPIDSHARVALRIYQVNQFYFGNGVTRQDYRVRIYTASVARSEPLVDVVVPVLSPPRTRAEWAAAHETLDLAGAHPQLAGAGHVNILIEPVDRPAAGSPQVPLFWAFATITNNQSQHVSLVTPK